MSDSKENSKPKDNKKMIKCKNCRQEIEAEKMFLHEGFCHRNNIFCDHCQKVFLKKDYQTHLKSTEKKPIRYLKTPDRPRRKEIDAKIQRINIYTSPIITKRKTTFEYIEMPMIEQYKVNNPIIISENGQILSNENKNDSLLPYFGISNTSNTGRNSIIGSDIIINQDEFSQGNSPNLFDNDMNVNQYIHESLKNSLTMKNINNNYNMLNEVYNMDMNNNKLNSKLNIIELTQKNDFLNNNNLTRSHSSKILLNNISLNDGEIKPQHNSLNNEFLQNHSDSKKLNIENKPKNNNIIINNNIITYNSNNNINKIHNFYNTEENPPNNNKKSLMNNDIFEDLSSTKFNSTRTSKKNEIIKFKKILEKNIKNNSSKKNSKEPNDNGSNNTPRNTKVTSHIFERSPQNTKNKKKNKSIQPAKEKKSQKNKKCEFCGSEVDDLVKHYKIYHYKMNKDMIKPQKRDTVLLNEKLESFNTDETGIDESNKKILLRELKPSINLLNNENKNKNLFKTEKKKVNPNICKSPERIKKVLKISLNNIGTNEKHQRKMFPEDNIRGSLIAKTQAREYERRLIYIGNNQNENENRLTMNGTQLINSDKFRDEFINNKNEKVKSHYLFTEEKKNKNFDKKFLAKSPVVKKINFLKTILDDNENL